MHDFERIAMSMQFFFSFIARKTDLNKVNNKMLLLISIDI